MTTEQQNVMEFMQAFGQVVNTTPTLLDDSTMILRLKLIGEEYLELCHAFGFTPCYNEIGELTGFTTYNEGTQDLVQVADGLVDIKYVVNGTAVSAGIDLEPIEAEVHRSNMTKLWPDGTVHYNADGKVIKPDTYSPANIEPLLIAQGMEV